MDDHYRWGRWQKEETMRKEIELVKKEARWAPGSWFGINVARLNLTGKEKKRLVAQGYRLTQGRGGKLILTYSQEARQKVLREKVGRR